MRNDNMLGFMGSDKVTGFRGRVTAVVEYLSGCTQVLLSPPVKDDGTEREGKFFDVQRVAIDSTIPAIVLDNSKTPGFQPGTVGRRELP
jgi:hypothetical protein